MKQDVANNFDSPFTLDEINLAINMQNNKAPGPNSLPVECFKKIYTCVCTESLLNGSQLCIKMSFSKAALEKTTVWSSAVLICQFR